MSKTNIAKQDRSIKHTIMQSLEEQHDSNSDLWGCSGRLVSHKQHQIYLPNIHPYVRTIPFKVLTPTRPCESKKHQKIRNMCHENYKNKKNYVKKKNNKKKNKKKKNKKMCAEKNKNKKWATQTVFCTDANALAK